MLSSLGLPIKISPGRSSRAGSKPKAILFSECLKGMEQIATVILTESHLPLCQLLLQPENSQHHSKCFLEEGQRNRQPRGHLSQVPRLLSLQLVQLSLPGQLCLFRIQASVVACVTRDPGSAPQHIPPRDSPWTLLGTLGPGHPS